MFGIFLWELFARVTPPYPADKNTEDGVISGNLRPAKINEYMCPPPVWDLMTKCWSQDPQQRPPMKEVCQTLEYIIRDANYNTFYKIFDVNAVANNHREDGKTNLHLAAEEGNAVLVEQFLLMGDAIDVDIKDKQGNTALEYAMRGNTPEHKLIVRMIENFIKVPFFFFFFLC